MSPIGNIGEPLTTREYEPIPETVPAHEPSPQPSEPIPA